MDTHGAGHGPEGRGVRLGLCASGSGSGVPFLCGLYPFWRNGRSCRTGKVGEREAVYIEKSGKRGIRKDSSISYIYIRKENVSK